MKAYKTFIFIGVFIVILIGFLVWLAQLSPEAEVSVLDNNIILFYGDGCPHCEDVEEFIEENDMTNKVDFVRLEVWNDRANAKILDDALVRCAVDPKTAGVPFLFARGECYVGTPQIEEFFTSEAGM